MSTGTLNGHAVTMARVQIPAWRGWYADVELADEVTLDGTVELVVADLTLSGTIVSGGATRGAARYRVAAGAGSWGSRVDARGYHSDAGVRRRTVMLDAAEAVGEALDLDSVPDDTVGAGFTRLAGPASAVLHALAPESWYVDTDGTTKIGKRDGEVLDVDAARTKVDLRRGRIELAAKDVADILPGVTIDELVVADVEHHLSPKGLRTTIWGERAGDTSRAMATVRRIVLQALPDLAYRGTYAYRVVTQETERLNLQPVRSSLGLPDLTRVRVMPGVAGCRADVSLGSTVLVTWVDADPGQPIVVAFDDAEAPGFAPDRLDLVGESETVVTDGAGTQEAGRALRYGDTVVMKVGQPPVDTPTVLIASHLPAIPASVSKVFP